MSNDDITRRTFVSATVGGIAAAAAGASAQQQVVEKTVAIKTPDGTCDGSAVTSRASNFGAMAGP